MTLISGVVLGATPHPQPLPCLKILGLNLLILIEGKYAPYPNSRDNIQGGNLLLSIYSVFLYKVIHMRIHLSKDFKKLKPTQPFSTSFKFKEIPFC